MDRESWRAGIHGVTKSQTRLSDCTELNGNPLPMTLRQLRGFLGITGYCHIWIPGYGGTCPAFI